MPNLPLWFNKGTILPTYNWQDFPVASHPSSNMAKFTFEPYGDDGQIYPSEIRRYLMVRRKWLTPSVMAEEPFFLWPQPEPYIKYVRVSQDIINLGFIQYVWQCRLLPARNEQVYYVTIQEI